MNVRRAFLCCSVAVFLVLPSAEGRGQADDCTSGFMDLDGMNKVLDNYIVNAPNGQQAIIPEINFTCSGTIRTWIIGGQWRTNGQNIELQIWRRNENGLYKEVESSEIHVTEWNATGLYWYHLPTSPLQFQEGDILGFYHPSQSQFRLRLAVRMFPLQTVYLRSGNPDNEFATTASSSSRMQNLLVSVETDHPECENGFMSLETMHALVGLGEVGRLSGHNRRQQITPTITFTCDGWITKWILGALWSNNKMLFPELQIWRNAGNNTYRKINGTFISVETSNPSLIYEYSDFSPIPFQAGDILGAFVARGDLNKLKLRSEGDRGHLNYFNTTSEAATESPYDSIDLSGPLSTAIYHPLVSVEISVSTATTTTYIEQSTHTTAVTSSLTLSPSTLSTDGVDATVTLSPLTHVHSTDEVDVTLYVSIGVSGAVVLVLIATVTGICVFIIMYLRNRQVKLVKTESAISQDENTYDYIPATVSTTDGNVIITTSPNEAYASINNVPVSSNQAYGMVHH